MHGQYANCRGTCCCDRPVGKQVGVHLYAHKSNIRHLPENIRALVAKALLVAGEFEYDLIKVANDRAHVCLLRYPTFDTHAHPELKYSIKVLLPSRQYCMTDYSNSANPPILHRKDLLVPPEYPLHAVFSRLTGMEEKYGLLNRGDIGTSKQWKALLTAKNLTIKGHSLTEKK